MTSEKATDSGAEPTPKDSCDTTETSTKATSSPKLKKMESVRGRIAMFEVIANNDSTSQSDQTRVQKELKTFKLDAIKDKFRIGGSLPPVPSPSFADLDDAKRRNSDHATAVRKASKSWGVGEQDAEKTTINKRSLIDESVECFGGSKVDINNEDSKIEEGESNDVSVDKEEEVHDSAQSDNGLLLQTEEIAIVEFPLEANLRNSLSVSEAVPDSPVACSWTPEKQKHPDESDDVLTDKKNEDETSAPQEGNGDENEKNKDNDESPKQEGDDCQESTLPIPDIKALPIDRFAESSSSTGADRDSAYISLGHQPSPDAIYESLSLSGNSLTEEIIATAANAIRRPSSGEYKKAKPPTTEYAYDCILDNPENSSVSHTDRKPGGRQRKIPIFTPCKATRSLSWRPISPDPNRSNFSRAPSRHCELRRRTKSVDHLDFPLQYRESSDSVSAPLAPGASVEERLVESFSSCSDVGFESSSEFERQTLDSTRTSVSARSDIYDADDDEESDPYDHPDHSQFLMLEDPYDTPSALIPDQRGRSDTGTTITQPRDSCQQSDYLCGACFEDHEEAEGCNSGISYQSPKNDMESEYDNLYRTQWSFPDVFEEIREDEDTIDVDLVNQRPLSPMFSLGPPSSLEPPSLPDRPQPENESDFHQKTFATVLPIHTSRKLSINDETETCQKEHRFTGSSSEENSQIFKGNRQRKLSDNSVERMMHTRKKSIGLERQLSLVPSTTDERFQAVAQFQEGKKKTKLKHLLTAKLAFKRSRSYQNVLSADERNVSLFFSDNTNDMSQSFDDSSQSSTPPPKLSKKRGRSLKKNKILNLLPGGKGKKEEKSEC